MLDFKTAPLREHRSRPGIFHFARDNSDTSKSHQGDFALIPKKKLDKRVFVQPLGESMREERCIFLEYSLYAALFN